MLLRWEQSPEQYKEGEVGMGRRANQPGRPLPKEESCYNITITMIFGCRKLSPSRSSYAGERGHCSQPEVIDLALLCFLIVLPILPQATLARSVQLD